MEATSRPDAHTQRYDRQLRLWASSGQASLESASVLLIGCTPTGTAALKNLVLPGIGSFTILDPRKVTDADKGANFFFDPDAESGKSWRAEEGVKLLSELNPRVKGHAKHESVTELIERDPDFFRSFTLIIASEVPQETLYKLSELCWNADDASSSTATPRSIPLLSVHTSGLMGQVTFQLKEAGIIETHPDSLISLRLTSPWPELEKYVASFNMSPEDSMERAHVPFIVVLVRTLQNWRSEHDGSLPDPSKDRKAFTDQVWACKHPDEQDAENVEEGVTALNSHVWRPIRQLSADKTYPGVPDEIKALFKDPACDQLNSNSTNFWLLTRALRNFVQGKAADEIPGGEGYLPQPGSLPDMKALSATYIEMQRLYHSKAEADLGNFTKYLEKVLQSAGVNAAIPEQEIRTFVKHAAFLKVIRGKKLLDQHQQPNAVDTFTAFSEAVQPPTLPHHIAFLAASDFYSKHQRYPGASSAFSRLVSSTEPAANDNQEEAVDVDQDSAELVEIAKKLAPKFGADLSDEDVAELIDNAAEEMARGAQSSLPSTSALVGGIVAQEVIKLVTRQYIPADNTVVYNGIQQAVGVFKL